VCEYEVEPGGQVWIREKVLEELDHHNIDMEVEPFRSGTVSTVENLAVWAWHRLEPAVPGPAKVGGSMDGAVRCGLVRFDKAKYGMVWTGPLTSQPSCSR